MEAPIAQIIARLVQERGWNQEDFARITNLNRHTIRLILQHPERKLRNATVQACAKALGLTVSELRHLPLEQLLKRMHGPVLGVVDEQAQRLLATVTQPELRAWLERNRERSGKLAPAEAAELVAMQGPDGPLAKLGVERVVELLERKRRLVERVRLVAGTEYLEFLERFVELLAEKIGA